MVDAKGIFTAIATTLLAGSAFAQQSRTYDLGQPAQPAQISAWDIDVRADGAGLPPGQGSVAQGQAIFTKSCAACHGSQGQGGAADPLVGGFGTLASAKPIRTVGSYWPYATTLYDYIHRAMPFNAPRSLSPDQIYAISAYILYLNHVIPQSTVLSRTTLPLIKMPNRNGFITKDPRPDVHEAPN